MALYQIGGAGDMAGRRAPGLRTAERKGRGMKSAATVALALAILLQAGSCGPAVETVRLKATADIWVSGFRGEEAFTAGKYPQFKLKSIQELAAIRFDAARAAGRQVRGARLVLRRAGKDQLRYVRVSTVNADWVEGTNAQRLAAGDGASYRFADNAPKRPWAWPGSQLCDVIMGSGHSLATWAQREQLPDGWIAVNLTPELIYALVAGDTDGLAVMDGGTPAFNNNFIHSVQSKWAPYIEVDLGGSAPAPPAAPKVRAEPDPPRAHLGSGAIKVTVAAADGVFCWRVKLDGRRVARWRVPHPAAKGPTVFTLDDLTPSKTHPLEVVAVAPGGAASRPTTVKATASPALAAPPTLRTLRPPAGGADPRPTLGGMRVWACPPLVKVSPETGKVMFKDAGDKEPVRRANAVWDGRGVKLFGARGETVSFQIAIDLAGPAKTWRFKIIPFALKGPGGATIGAGQFDLYRNWYAKNKSGKWQPAYCVPIKAAQAVQVPDPKRKIDKQANQSFYVDLYIPKDAAPGRYARSIGVTATDAENTPAGWALGLPISLEVFDFALPDRLSFWPQLNTYSIPTRWHDYFRLAHNHRCVYYYRFGGSVVPTTGRGKDLKIDWGWWDRVYAPLLTGEAFKDCRRASVPIEAIALPFWDSWPTPLTKATYDYPGDWPKRGDSNQGLIDHYLKAPYIADALSDDYKAAFAAAVKQFIEHFKAKGWTRTECQCVFVGKNTHRIAHGANMWWTTDEPYHWDDWQALWFFNDLFVRARDAAGGDPDRWVTRADISRPQWQGRVLHGAIDTVYFGGFAGAARIRRCRTLAREAPLELRAYGGVSADNGSNTASLAWIVNCWLNGASAALPWQTLGNDRALDVNDSAVGGAAMICPGERFGAGPVADIRLKAFRDGEQLIEYLHLAEARCGLNREQVRAMVAPAVRLQGAARSGAGADNADAVRFAALKAWQIAGLRRALAELIVKKAAP